MSQKTGVIVVGSITADVTTFSERLPQRGETVLGDDVTLVLGGKGANQALAASRADVPTYFVGCIGDDLFGTLVRDGLERDEIDLTDVRVLEGRTGVAHIRVDRTGENDIVIVPLANDAVSADQIDGALDRRAGQASVLLTQCEVPTDATVHAVASAHARGLTVVLDPAPAVAFDDDVWRHVDFVTPNESEARFYTGVDVVDHQSAVEAGRWFCARGARHALITLADSGAVLVSESGATTFDVFSVDAVDTTAAGDAFAGHFGAALAQGAPTADAVRTAMAAGALAVTKRGASPSIPTKSEVAALVQTRPAAVKEALQ